MKKLLIIALVFLMVFTITACDKPSFMEEKDLVNLTGDITGTITVEFRNNNYESVYPDIPYETLSFKITADDYKKAPITVTNFIKLVRDGYFAGTYFSAESTRLVFGQYYDEPDKETEGEFNRHVTKELDYTIIGEFKDNKWEKNDTAITVGSLYMVLSGGNNSAEGAVGIVRDNDHAKALKDKIAVFGKVPSPGDVNRMYDIVTGYSNYKAYIKSITITPADPGLGTPKTIKK